MKRDGWDTTALYGLIIVPLMWAEFSVIQFPGSIEWLIGTIIYLPIFFKCVHFLLHFN